MVSETIKNEEYVVSLKGKRRELLSAIGRGETWINWDFVPYGKEKSRNLLHECNRPLILITGFDLIKEHKDGEKTLKIKAFMEDHLSRKTVENELTSFLKKVQNSLIGVLIDISKDEALGLTVKELVEIYGVEKCVVDQKIVAVSDIVTNSQDTITLLLKTWRSDSLHLRELEEYLKIHNGSYIVQISDKQIIDSFRIAKRVETISFEQSYISSLFVILAFKLAEHFGNPIIVFDNVFEFLSGVEKRIVRDYLHKHKLSFAWEGGQNTFSEEQVNSLPRKLIRNQIFYSLTHLAKGIAKYFSQSKEARLKGFVSKDFELQTNKHRCKECLETLEDDCINCGASRVDEIGMVSIDGIQFGQVLKSSVNEISSLINDKRVDSVVSSLCEIGFGEYRLNSFAAEVSVGDFTLINSKSAW